MHSGATMGECEHVALTPADEDLGRGNHAVEAGQGVPVVLGVVRVDTVTGESDGAVALLFVVDDEGEPPQGPACAWFFLRPRLPSGPSETGAWSPVLPMCRPVSRAHGGPVKAWARSLGQSPVSPVFLGRLQRSDASLPAIRRGASCATKWSITWSRPLPGGPLSSSSSGASPMPRSSFR